MSMTAPKQPNANRLENPMKKTIALTTALMLAACAPPMTADQKAALLAASNRPVTCKSGDDCQQKWSRATQWVKQNSAYKFQTISDNLMQTMGPLPDDPSPAYTVTKVSTGKNIYTIELDGGCDNWIGCIPSIVEAKASFASFVMGKGK